VGNYRRQLGLQSADANFFAAGNSDGQRVREEMAMAVQEAMYLWLHESDSESSKRRVAIFDATNTTISRRFALAQKARKENVFLLFVESICTDQKVLQKNYELKLQNDDYKGMDHQKAMLDFLDRVAAYEKVYQSIEDDEDNNNISYIKLINVGQKVITRNCTGYLPSQVAFYLQNVHIEPRSIYLCLNAENFDLVEDSGRLGGAESGRLTESGRDYSRDVARYLQVTHQEGETIASVEQHAKAKERDLLVLAGTAKVHAETLLHLRMLFSCYNTPLLNELRGGDMHTLSKEEIRVRDCILMITHSQYPVCLASHGFSWSSPTSLLCVDCLHIVDVSISYHLCPCLSVPSILQMRYPQEYANREADKLRYRYPGGT